MDDRLIQEVLESLGSKRIKHSGGNIIGSCPFASYTHGNGEDRNPSFSVSINGSGPSSWHCFACKCGGKKSIGILYEWKKHTGEWKADLYSRIRDQEGMAPSERLKRLGSWNDQKKKQLQQVGPSAGSNWHVDGYEGKFDEENFKDYFETVPRYALDRGITIDQAKKWKIGFHKEYKRLFFTILDEDRHMVGWSARAIFPDQEPKYLHAEYMRRDKYLYGEAFIDRSSRLGFITEGFMDVLNLERLGIKNALGTMGTGCSPGHIEKLKRYFDKVMILPHNDPENEKGESPGKKMADAYASALRNVGVGVIIAPVVQGKKDPGDWTIEDINWVFDVVRKQRNAVDARAN